MGFSKAQQIAALIIGLSIQELALEKGQSRKEEGEGERERQVLFLPFFLSDIFAGALDFS